MNNREHMIRTALVALTCFALCQFAPEGFGVVPAPDGGYPGFNTAEGQNALKNLTTGVGNSAVGWYSLFSDTDGSFNTAVGAGALVLNLGNQSTNEGTENTATGTGALLSNTTGGANTANGAFALFSNTTGLDNTATGLNALFSNTIAGGNTAIGSDALFYNTGSNNTAIGSDALFNNITGNNNIALGVFAGGNVTTASNVICIGVPGNDINDSCFIGNIFGATSLNGVAVLINSNGRLGTMTSSARFKDQIKPMDEASEVLFALKPVSFRYKKEIDPAGTSQFGLVAEDVEKVNPDLVVRDKHKKPYSVRYDQVNAMLLNEFLKEHRKVEEQEATITRLTSHAAKEEATISQLKKGMGVLTAQLKEQAAQIQKVSAQLDMQQPSLQTVAKDSIE